MNRLKGTQVYLSGAIEYAGLDGGSWRDEIIPQLREMGIGILNPLDKPTLDSVDDENNNQRQFRVTARENGEYDYVSEKMRDIVGCDLRMCDKADFIICFIDIDVYTVGTIHEIIVSAEQHKPILLVCKQGKNKVPLWFFGILPHELFFDNLNDMMDYIKHIDTADVVDDMDKWRFFDYDKVFNKKGG